MQFPVFLPLELASYKKFNTPLEVFEALKSNLDDAVLFFEVGCEHESWCQQPDGKELMKLLFLWLTEMFFQRKLSLIQLELIANSVHGKYKMLEDILPLDISFKIGADSIPANSLMFGASSDLIRDIIWRQGLEKNQTVVPLNVSPVIFEQFKEYIYTGIIEYLWKEEPKEILNVIRRAGQWHIAGLAEFSAAVFRRYFALHNVVEYLLMAHHEVLFSLKYEACSFLNKQGYGITLIPREANELDVEIEAFTDEGITILSEIGGILTHITCHSIALESEDFINLIKKKERLIGLNLADTSSIRSELIDILPNVKDLNLSNCNWVNDGVMIRIIVRTAGLIHLKLAENIQLTFRTWGALASLPQLSTLDISECRNFDDDELDLLSTSSSHLVKLLIAGCTKITDKGIITLVKHCLLLEILSVARCTQLTKTGLLVAVTLGKNLQRVDITGCGLPEDTEEMIHHINPQLKIKA
jgi:hypothetical protein